MDVDGRHTVTWDDGFRITRIASEPRTGTLWLEIEWQGRKRTLRLLKTKTEVQREAKR